MIDLDEIRFMVAVTSFLVGLPVLIYTHSLAVAVFVSWINLGSIIKFSMSARPTLLLHLLLFPSTIAEIVALAVYHGIEQFIEKTEGILWTTQ